MRQSAVPKRGGFKRGRTQKECKRAQRSAKERKRRSAKERKGAQKSASTHRLQTTRFGSSEDKKSVKRSAFFHWMRARHLVNEGFGKESYRKGNSVKGSGLFSEPPDSKVEIFCAHPLPKSWLLLNPVWKWYAEIKETIRKTTRNVSENLCSLAREETKGVVKGRLWRMCARSGNWGPGISKIIAFFCQGSTAVKIFGREFRYRGTSAKATLLRTPDSCLRIP